MTAPTENASTSTTQPMPASRIGWWTRLVVVIILLAVGITLGVGGLRLWLLGGSGYYLSAGVAYVISAVLLFFRVRITSVVAVAIFIATAVWAVKDAPALGYWTLVPRLGLPALLLLLTLLAGAWLPKSHRIWRGIQLGGAILMALALVVTFIAGFSPHASIHNDVHIAERSLLPGYSPDWPTTAGDSNNNRFAPVNRITPDNVHHLHLAWSYPMPRPPQEAPERGQASIRAGSPVQVGKRLYSCAGSDMMTAIDSATGKPQWRFNPDTKAARHCSTVAWYDIDDDASLSPAEQSDYKPQQCRQRILAASGGNLYAVDAATGKACDDFGEHGHVTLPATQDNALDVHSTAPVVAGHLAIIGSWETGHHSDGTGVVSAIDIRTGKIRWTWNPANGDAEHRGAPHIATQPTYDADLNTLYVTTGSWSSNNPQDQQQPSDSVQEQYGSAVIAMDVSTGKERWRFQTVHHDVWGYGLTTQPALTDMLDSQHRRLPALIQPTDTGDIFVLDRLTGKPITAVDEHAVPIRDNHQGLSRTQPVSSGMPVLDNQTLSEQDMWGLTPLDQLSCRITFHNARFQGNFTPPSEQSYIQYPANSERFGRDGVSIDPTRRLLFINNTNLAELNQRDSHGRFQSHTLASSMGVPCTNPPFGTLSAISLDSHQLVWQVPMGTAANSGPLGIHSQLPMPVGMPTAGAPSSTLSGVVFFSGTHDNDLMAVNAANGQVLSSWKLPAPAISAPTIYQSPENRHEYVAVTIQDPHTHEAHIMAFALPDGSRHH